MLWDENDIYGGIYDLDGNGYTDASEVALSFQMIEDMNRQEEDSDDAYGEDADESADFYYALPAGRSVSVPETSRATSSDGRGSGGTQKNAAASPAGTGNALPASEEKHISYGEYKTERGVFFLTCLISAGLFLGLSAIPVLFIWAALNSRDPTNSVDGQFTAFVVISCLVVIFVILYGTGKPIVEALGELIKTRECYRRSAPEPELRKIRKKKITVIAVVSVLLFAGLAGLIAAQVAKTQKLVKTYNAALQQIDDGAYREAYATLQSIEDEHYKDTESLEYLCLAHMEYERDYTYSAYDYLKKTHFRYLSEEQQQEIDAFRSELKSINDKKDRDWEAYERQLTEERIINGVPFVGMRESRIGDTTLGKPADEVRHNSEIKNNTLCHFNLYDWYRNGQIIFIARCLNGEVYQVWDYRSNPITPYQPKSGSKKKYEFPDYDDYLDAEDLYDWYYDDFYDYEEAEEYLDDWD